MRGLGLSATLLAFSSIDAWMVAALAVLVILLAFLALAETGIGRISKVRAQTMFDGTGSKSAKALLGLVSAPEHFLNPVLLAVNIAQVGQSFIASARTVRVLLDRGRQSKLGEGKSLSAERADALLCEVRSGRKGR